MPSLTEKRHSNQVTVLSETLFNQLKSIHHLGEKELDWLKKAAVLHDIGWIGGGKKHHKRSRDMILKYPYLPFSGEERLVIALIARYHRGSSPKNTHRYFKDLAPALKNRVAWLSAILRISDGLDRTHLGSIKNIRCRLTKNRIALILIPKSIPIEDRISGLDKADMLEKYSERKIIIHG